MSGTGSGRWVQLTENGSSVNGQFPQAPVVTQGYAAQAPAHGAIPVQYTQQVPVPQVQQAQALAHVAIPVQQVPVPQVQQAPQQVAVVPPMALPYNPNTAQAPQLARTVPQAVTVPASQVFPQGHFIVQPPLQAAAPMALNFPIIHKSKTSCGFKIMMAVCGVMMLGHVMTPMTSGCREGGHGGYGEGGYDEGGYGEGGWEGGRDGGDDGMGWSVVADTPEEDHGCVDSAGYVWCESVLECVRPWETTSSFDVNHDGVVSSGEFESGCAATPLLGVAEEEDHGCVASAGYVWCESASECLRHWEAAASFDVNDDGEVSADEFESGCAATPLLGVAEEEDHGCVASAGYVWCESASECLRHWEAASSFDVNDDGEVSADEFESGCAVTPLLGVAEEEDHGCVASAGYVWCESASKCLRHWEAPALDLDGDGEVSNDEFESGCALVVDATPGPVEGFEGDPESTSLDRGQGAGASDTSRSAQYYEGESCDGGSIGAAIVFDLFLAIIFGLMFAYRWPKHVELHQNYILLRTRLTSFAVPYEHVNYIEKVDCVFYYCGAMCKFPRGMFTSFTNGAFVHAKGCAQSIAFTPADPDAFLASLGSIPLAANLARR